MPSPSSSGPASSTSSARAAGIGAANEVVVQRRAVAAGAAARDHDARGRRQGGAQARQQRLDVAAADVREHARAQHVVRRDVAAGVQIAGAVGDEDVAHLAERVGGARAIQRVGDRGRAGPVPLRLPERAVHRRVQDEAGRGVPAGAAAHEVDEQVAAAARRRVDRDAGGAAVVAAHAGDVDPGPAAGRAGQRRRVHARAAVGVALARGRLVAAAGAREARDADEQP